MRSLFFDIHRTITKTVERAGYSIKTALKALGISRSWYYSGYRMIRKFLAKTTSRIHRVKLVYFHFTILLYKLWVMLNLMY